MSDALLRVGVAGLGVGLRIHVPVLQAISRVQVVALAGTDKKRVDALAAQHHVDVGCEGLDDFFEQRLDAVILALPPTANEVAVKRALERGLPVLAEKPLASSSQIALQLVQLAGQQTTMMDFYFSDIAAFKMLKRLIKTREYGEVRHVQVQWFVESFAQQNQSWSWKTDGNQSGGVVSMLGSHILYLAEWLFGPIQGLCALTNSQRTSTFTPATECAAPDYMSLMIGLPAGVELSVIASNASPAGIGHRWEVVFDQGTAILHNPRVDYHVDFSFIMRTGNEEKILHASDPVPPTDARSPFRILLERFVNAARARIPTVPDIAAGARVQCLMEAISRSAQDRQYTEVAL